MVYNMDKELLTKIEDLNFWHKVQEMGIRRDELSAVLKLADDPQLALIISGVRRAGKTTLAKQILQEKLQQISPEQTLIINFEDPILEPYLNTEALQELYQTYRYFLNREKLAYIILDEVHTVPKWEKWVRIMLEKNENVKFIITGSSSKVFSSDLARVLSGRTIPFSLFPLRFSNFLQFQGYVPKKYESYSSLSTFFQEYLEYGGFPLVVKSTEKNLYLKQLFEDIIVKDIILKYKLREPDIKKLAVLLINNVSSLTSVKRLQTAMQEIAKVKMSPTSINDYLYYFEDSFLFFFVPIFSYKIREQLQYPRKVYCIDTGMINALTLKFSENKGKLYENSVALTLLRRYGKENIFYWKDIQQHEVDFVVKEGLTITKLIQVCAQLAPKTKERELRSLLKAMAEFKIDQGIVVTEEYEDRETINGQRVQYVPLWKWLLAEESTGR